MIFRTTLFLLFVNMASVKLWHYSPLGKCNFKYRVSVIYPIFRFNCGTYDVDIVTQNVMKFNERLEAGRVGLFILHLLKYLIPKNTVI